VRAAQGCVDSFNLSFVVVFKIIPATTTPQTTTADTTTEPVTMTTSAETTSDGKSTQD